MKTDSIFYRLFQEFPSIFFELIGSSPDEAIGYEFTSREVKQLAFRIDGLFLPTTEELSLHAFKLLVMTDAEKRRWGDAVRVVRFVS